jgi:hypothetical protein
MPHNLTETDRARLLARAQKLKDAQLDDFGDEAREHWNGRQPGLLRYSGTDQQLRKQLIDAGFAEVIQRGARSRPGILKIWPNGDAPRYVPRERKRAGERERPVRDRVSVGALNPKDVIKFTQYLQTRKEAWRSRRGRRSRTSSRTSRPRSISWASIAFVKRVGSVSGSDGWRMHLRGISSGTRSSSSSHTRSTGCRSTKMRGKATLCGPADLTQPGQEGPST